MRAFFNVDNYAVFMKMIAACGYCLVTTPAKVQSSEIGIEMHLLTLVKADETCFFKDL